MSYLLLLAETSETENWQIWISVFLVLLNGAALANSHFVQRAKIVADKEQRDSTQWVQSQMQKIAELRNQYAKWASAATAFSVSIYDLERLSYQMFGEPNPSVELRQKVLTAIDTESREMLRHSCTCFELNILDWDQDRIKRQRALAKRIPDLSNVVRTDDTPRHKLIAHLVLILEQDVLSEILQVGLELRYTEDLVLQGKWPIKQAAVDATLSRY